MRRLEQYKNDIFAKTGQEIRMAAEEAAAQTANRGLRKVGRTYLAQTPEELSQIGEVRIAQGSLDAALRSFAESRTLAADLVSRDPTNAEWQSGLGTLDFYARANVIEFRVEPQHVNNPSAGNIQGIGAGGVFPFSDAQFDNHEGINDPENLAVIDGDPDPVTRLPAGTLIIGMHGERIIQPPGAVVNTGSI